MTRWAVFLFRALSDKDSTPFNFMSNRVNPPETIDPNIGKNLRSQLEQIKLIATGGMAYVFRAFQPSLGRYIVVKRLKDELLANGEAVERFRREARALASVLHHNVAHVYDFVETPGEAFILMEHIEGVDLSTVIEKLGNLPPPVAAAIMLGVARGLHHIHAHGLIHRDIKPSNIRLTSRGGVKLMDFGIVLDFSDTSLTRPGMMVGSPSYLSPEQVLGDVISPQSDLFLLGISLYEMLVGSRPFKAEGGGTVFQRIREAKFIPARKMNGKVPAELDRIVSRCLKQDPAERFDGVVAFLDALERYLGPTISNRPEEVVLKFLDDEALVKSDLHLHPLKLTGYTRKPWMKWLAIPLVLGAIAVAYGFGHRRGVSHQQSQQAAVDALDAKAKSKDSKKR